MVSFAEFALNKNVMLRSERLRRVRIAMTVASATFGIIFMLIRSVWGEKLFYELRVLFYLTNPLVVLVLFTFSGIMLLMMYLQTGFKRAEKDLSTLLQYEVQFKKLLDLIYRLEDKQSVKDKDISILQNEVHHILSKLEKTPGVIDEKQKNALIADLKADLTAGTATEILDELKHQAASRFAVEAWSNEILNQFKNSFQRLNMEVSAQGRRGNLNLVLGIVTTVSGLVLLAYFVLNLQPPQAGTNLTEFTKQFIPRLSLVGFIELFAFFFLRLYKASLAEIKYFQNELTNVESKAIALRASVNTQNEEVIAEAIQSLANTERNRILEKDQTTPDLEKAKIEAKSISDLTKDFAEILKKYKQ